MKKNKFMKKMEKRYRKNTRDPKHWVGILLSVVTFGFLLTFIASKLGAGEDHRDDYSDLEF